MFSTDSNINSLAQLVQETRQYIELRMDLARHDLTAKLIALLSALCVAVLILIVLAVSFLLLSFSLVQALHDWLHSESAAYLIVSGGYLVLAGVIYATRRRLIYNPVANFIGHLFLDGHAGPDGMDNGTGGNDGKEVER